MVGACVAAVRRTNQRIYNQITALGAFSRKLSGLVRLHWGIDNAVDWTNQ
jgi:hypothetical protein